MKMKVKNYLFSSFDIIMQTKFLGINCSLGGSNLEGLYRIVWVQLLGCCDVRNNIDKLGLSWAKLSSSLSSYMPDGPSVFI